MAEDLDIPRLDRRHRTGCDSRDGRAAPGDHRRPLEARVQRRSKRRQAPGRLQETLTRAADGEGRYVRQTGGRGQHGHAKIHLFPSEPGHRLRLRERDCRWCDSEGVHQADRRRHGRSADTRCSGRLPGSTTSGSSVRRPYHDVDSSEMAFKIAGRWHSRTRRRRRSRHYSSRSCALKSWSRRITSVT